MKIPFNQSLRSAVPDPHIHEYPKSLTQKTIKNRFVFFHFSLLIKAGNTAGHTGNIYMKITVTGAMKRLNTYVQTKANQAHPARCHPV